MDNLEFCEFTLKRKHMLHPLLNSSILHSTLFLQLNWNKCSSVTTKKQTGKSHTKLLRTVAPAHIPPCLTGGVPALSSPETDEELPICKYRTSPLSSSTKLFALHKALCSPPTRELIFNWIFPILLSVLDFWEECYSLHSSFQGQAGERP